MKVAVGSIMERAPAGRLFEAIITLAELPAAAGQNPARRESMAESAAAGARQIRHRAAAR